MNQVQIKKYSTQFIAMPTTFFWEMEERIDVIYNLDYFVVQDML